MTSLEQRAIQALPRISFNMLTWHQERAKALYRYVFGDPLWVLTELERADLWLLIWRYRRQVSDVELVAHADELLNDALGLKW